MRVNVIGGGPGGLFLAILVKKARPDAQITILERNGPDDTFGWGVVFSDETLGGIRAADPESCARIEERFAHWTDIDVVFRGETVRSGGHGFAGLSRRVLLNILQERAAELGVDVRFRQEVRSLADVRDADLVVAADGVNSRSRAELADRVRPTVEKGRAKYVWFGTTRPFDAFTFIVRENEHGLFQVHAYRYDDEHSTFIVECDPESWKRAGLDEAKDAGVAYCQELFAPELQGAPLLTNKSQWTEFQTVSCERWSDGNVVLLGDAVHTAHFSIGSGTKLAMEDAIALAGHVVPAEPSAIPEALEAYESERKLDVLKTQRVASHSQAWFEEIARYKEFHPLQFSMALLSRSKKLNHANLKKRDPAFVAQVDHWFAVQAGVRAAPPPPPMFTPLTLRGLTLRNRVVVSPMCMYSADQGTVDDWHLVHLGSRALGGAGLVMAEMTDVTPEGRITPGCAGMWSDEHVPAWKRVTDFVHRWSDAAVGVQLAHAGRKGSTCIPWRGGAPLEGEDAWTTCAPSALAWDEKTPAPREMTRADLDAVRDAFVRGARLAAAAGFDLVELHAAHGYLLSSFLSPATNRRTDAYGGPLANRMRWPLEVFEAVRAAWPAERPVSVRISATDWLPGGFGSGDAVTFARELKALGCDVVDASSGGLTPESKPAIYGRMYQVPFSDRIRNEAQIPTMAVGNITDWDQANTILASGRADLVVLARQHLRDPYFTLHAAQEQGWKGVRWPDQYGAVRNG
jgi:anthraniloyl-CoA monooxygenase